MRTILINLLIAGSFLFSGCSIYKVDIRQGNELEPEQIAKLKVGMSKQQITFLLGHPLLTDPFHKNRWDYVRTFREGRDKTTRQWLVLFFEEDKLVRVDDSQLEIVELDD